jgi:hypothetical protein
VTQADSERPAGRAAAAAAAGFKFESSFMKLDSPPGPISGFPTSRITVEEGTSS